MKTATELAQKIADQELEACVEWIAGQDWTWTSAQLRRARRPKSPSLKQQALEALEQVDGWAVTSVSQLAIHENLVAGVDTIRRALEALPDD